MNISQPADNLLFKHSTDNDIEFVLSYDNLRYYLVRHDDAVYSLNISIAESSEPLQLFNKSAQPSEDLTETGISHAEQMAYEYFSNFDCKNNEIAFFSSALTRARQTAAIFLRVAKEIGYKIKIISGRSDSAKVQLLNLEEFENVDEKRKRMYMKRNQVHKELFENQGNAEIRTLGLLSLDYLKQSFVDSIYLPYDYIQQMKNDNAAKLPAAYKDIWTKCRKVIEADNRGDWGANFLTHSVCVQAMFRKYKIDRSLDDSTIPSLSSVRDLYNGIFRNILKLMEKADDMLDFYESSHSEQKKIKIIGFTHENQLLYFLKKEFNKVGVDKSSAIGFKILKDNSGNNHFIACMPQTPNNPKEIEFPSHVSG